MVETDLGGRLDWPATLARHDLVWGHVPLCKPESPEPMMRGAFLGNALLGALVYGEEEPCDFPHHALRVDIGRADIADRGGQRLDGTEWWDKWGIRNKTTRLHTGGFRLLTKALGRADEMRLDLWNAECRAQLLCGHGGQPKPMVLRAMVCAADPVIVLDVSHHDHDRRPRWVRRGMTLPGWPPPQNAIDDGICVETQRMLDGQEYAIAWCEVVEAGRVLLYVSLGVSPGVKRLSCDSSDTRSAAQEARDAVAAARVAGIDALQARHRDWWHGFYRASHVAIPDARMEGFHWIGQYKLGCTTRPTMPLPDETGPWSYAMGGPDDWAHCPGYPHIWLNLNAQLHYLPHLSSNHPEAGENLMEALVRYGRRVLGETPDPRATAGIGGGAGYDLYSGDRERPLACHLVWLLQTCWLCARYAATPRSAQLWRQLLPLLAAGMNEFIAKLREGDDGRLHMHDTQSPEYPARPPTYPVDSCQGMVDANYELALCRWGAARLLADLPDDVRAPQWRAAIQRLTDYQADEWGLRISREVPCDKGHRHFSHLMMIWPLREWAWEDQSRRELIARSLGTWLGVPPDYKSRTGFTWTAASMLGAHCHRGELAAGHLDTYFDEKPRGTARRFANTMVREWGFCMETGMAAAAAILDMLIQSHGGLLRIFPAVPPTWQDAQFHELRGEGGFLASARREGGRTIWARVQSLAGEEVRLHHGIPHAVHELSGGMKASVDGQDLVLSGPAGGSVVVHATDVPRSALGPVEHRIRSSWRWGEP